MRFVLEVGRINAFAALIFVIIDAVAAIPLVNSMFRLRAIFIVPQYFGEALLRLALIIWESCGDVGVCLVLRPLAESVPVSGVTILAP